MKSSLSDLAFLNGGNLNYLESLYQESLRNGVEGAWEQIAALLPEVQPLTPADVNLRGSREWMETAAHKQGQVSKLIMGYRSLGHLVAEIDPIDTMPRGDAVELELEQFSLSKVDLDSEFDTGDLAGGGAQDSTGNIGLSQGSLLWADRLRIPIPDFDGAAPVADGADRKRPC